MDLLFTDQFKIIRRAYREEIFLCLIIQFDDKIIQIIAIAFIDNRPSQSAGFDFHTIIEFHPLLSFL